jgi:5-formyltetrahydrofolate cyclo-ligase
MSRRIHRAALAVTLDGTMLVNVAQFEGEPDPDALLRQALEQAGRVFIGVVLTPRETQQTMQRIDHASAEAAAFVIGARQRRRRVTARKRRNAAS